MGGSRPHGTLPIRAAAGLTALLLALVTVFLLAEVGLRLARQVALWRRDAAGSSAGKVILCIGDSWTYGMESGDPAKYSYPAQLQRAIDAKLGAGRYRVVNRGKPGRTSVQLQEELQGQLETLSPEVVVIMVGAANFFRSMGSPERGWSPGPWLQRSKVVSTLALLGHRAGGHFALPDMKHVKDALALALQDRPPPPGGEGVEPGRPPLPPGPCPGATWAALARDFRVARPRGIPAMEQALGPGLGCRRLLTRAAEQCLLQGHLRGAAHFAGRSLALGRDGNSRALVALARARQRLDGRWTEATSALLHEALSRRGDYTRAWRVWALSQLSLDDTLCPVKQAAQEAGVRCPACPWVRRVQAIMARQVEAPGRRALERDMGRMVLRLRHQGSRVMLLNYPAIAGDICSLMVRPVLSRLARQLGLPIIELQRVLGRHSADVKNPNYAAQQHPSARGYGVIAGAVLAKMRELVWLK